MTTFTVTAQRGSGQVWVLECAEAGAVSQTRRLDHAADEMREAIAYQTGLDESEVDIIVDPILPDDVAALKSSAETLRQQADNANQQAAHTIRDLAAHMRQRGYSLRDMGTILGVSHQRAAALANSTADAPPASAASG